MYEEQTELIIEPSYGYSVYGHCTDNVMLLGWFDQYESAVDHCRQWEAYEPGCTYSVETSWKEGM